MAAALIALMPVAAVKSASAATGTNLINNPSVITDTTGWTATDWSTNTRNLTRESAGRTDNGALRAEVTTLGTGADGWYFNPVVITSGQSYEFSFWYQSNVATQVDANFVVNGVETYQPVGNVPASASWAQYKTTITAPAGATSVTLTNYVTQVGYTLTDDYSLTSYTAAPFNRPIVSVTFDDGWANQYINGRQVLKDNGINSTFYLVSNELANGSGTAQDYMTAAQAKDLLADGHEIASHTTDHCSLNGTTKEAGCPVPTTQWITTEMTKSKNDIQTLVPGSTVTNFAYPYGEYSTESINIGKNIYTSQRTVECGQNTKDTLDLHKLKACDIGASATVDYVKGLIDAAIANKTWIILFYHEIADAGQGVPGDEAYTVSKANFTAVMQYIKSRQADIDNMSVAKAINATDGTVTPQPEVTVTPVYRFFRYAGGHFFTTSEYERNIVRDTNAGYRYEGVAFNAYNKQVAGSQPVYRLYDLQKGYHFYTISQTEYQQVASLSQYYRDEGVAYYAKPAAGADVTPVFRFYDYQQGIHFYTTNTQERDHLIANVSHIYRYEGIGYYLPVAN